ncbi:MAG: hypothetical protein AMJ79_09580 [Phycisphaerae bacterium SM23_30]|nr:MAG: hypothetical protein AMJ79_09580 [Phycisphaerae bacterium SM23_30]
MTNFKKEYEILGRKYRIDGNKDAFIKELKKLQSRSESEGFNAWSIYLKGRIALEENRLDETVKIFNELVRLFGKSTDMADLSLVAKALVSKGVAFNQMKKEKEEFKAYDEVIKKFYDAKEIELKESVARALFNKGIALGEQKNTRAEIEAYDQLVRRFGEDEEVELKEMVATTLFNKGVALGDLNKSNEEIKVYDEIIRRCGKAQEIELKEQIAMALINKGVLMGKLKRFEEAVKIFDEVIKKFHDTKTAELKENVATALLNKGIVLEKKEKTEEAVAAYEELDKRYGNTEEKVLKEIVAAALINKGETLSRKGRHKDAIKVYNKVIHRCRNDDTEKIKIQVAMALSNKGLALSDKKQEEAIKLFDMALKINPKNATVWRNRSISEYNRGNLKRSFEDIRQAIKIKPDEYKNVFRFICRTAGRNFEKEWKKLFPKAKIKEAKAEERLPELQAFIVNLRKAYKKEADEFLKKKKEWENKQQQFLTPESNLDNKYSVFMVLRRWNSYTPAIPTSDRERSKGGGYFLWHKGKGFVIDPGYNFLENFHEAGCRICDIDNIILTHAHNDHTIDFESIMTLLNEYNKRLEEVKNKEEKTAQKKSNIRTKKKVNIYLNNGSFMKFSGLLDLRDKKCIEKIYTLNAGHDFSVGKHLKMRVLPSYHDESLSRDQSVGLFFTIRTGKKVKRLLLTSDTGLFPLKNGKQQNRIKSKREEIWRAYKISEKNRPDLMVVHIGSIKEEELSEKYRPDPKEACYPNHLGIIGSAWVIAMCRPKLSVVSEFGEEMQDFRYPLLKGLQENVFDKFFEDEPEGYVPRVIPGDLALMYELETEKFYDCVKGKWAPCEEIDFRVYNKGRDADDGIYYFEKGKSDEFEQDMKNIVDQFKANRKRAKGEMYFKSD